MKLYLSSIGTPNTEAFLSLFPQNTSLSVAIIPTAWEAYSKERSEPEIEKVQTTFTELGFAPTLIDLKTKTGDELKAELKKYSAAWVTGGNSFYLNYYVRKSGLHNFIEQLLNDGLVYGGESAGAVLAGPTLHGVELLDDPKEAPGTVWEGLSLVDFGIVPHWGMDKYAKLLQQCKVEMEKHVSDIRTLTNEQALVISGEAISLIEASLKDQK